MFVELWSYARIFCVSVSLLTVVCFLVVLLGKSPDLSTPCKCHYAGSLIDGTEFDSSYKRGEPLTLAPNQVIKGWTEAMQLMKEGAKWELYIPSELGYGDRGAGGAIPGGAALVFTMELLEVTG